MIQSVKPRTSDVGGSPVGKQRISSKLRSFFGLKQGRSTTVALIMCQWFSMQAVLLRWLLVCFSPFIQSYFKAAEAHSLCAFSCDSIKRQRLI